MRPGPVPWGKPGAKPSTRVTLLSSSRDQVLVVLDHHAQPISENLTDSPLHGVYTHKVHKPLSRGGPVTTVTDTSSFALHTTCCTHSTWEQGRSNPACLTGIPPSCSRQKQAPETWVGDQGPRVLSPSSICTSPSRGRKSYLHLARRKEGKCMRAASLHSQWIRPWLWSISVESGHRLLNLSWRVPWTPSTPRRARYCGTALVFLLFS